MKTNGIFTFILILAAVLWPYQSGSSAQETNVENAHEWRVKSVRAQEDRLVVARTIYSLLEEYLPDYRTKVFSGIKESTLRKAISLNRQSWIDLQQLFISAGTANSAEYLVTISEIGIASVDSIAVNFWYLALKTHQPIALKWSKEASTISIELNKAHKRLLQRVGRRINPNGLVKPVLLPPPVSRLSLEQEVKDFKREHLRISNKLAELSGTREEHIDFVRRHFPLVTAQGLHLLSESYNDYPRYDAFGRHEWLQSQLSFTLALLASEQLAILDFGEDWLVYMRKVLDLNSRFIHHMEGELK